MKSGYKNNLFGIGRMHEFQGLVIVNPFGEMGELDYEKVYDVSKLGNKEAKKIMLMYPIYEILVSNLKLIRETEPIIYLAPSQKNEIEFLKAFFDVKAIKFSKDLFLGWLGFPTSDLEEIKRIANSNNYARCLYIYLSLYENYGLLLNPNMFRKTCGTAAFLFKDIETLEKIASIKDFGILKQVILNFSKYDLTSEFIHELLFLICSKDDSERKEALFEIAKYLPGSNITLNCKEEIIKDFIDNSGYLKKENNKYIANF